MSFYSSLWIFTSITPVPKPKNFQLLSYKTFYPLALFWNWKIIFELQKNTSEKKNKTNKQTNEQTNSATSLIYQILDYGLKMTLLGRDK